MANEGKKWTKEIIIKELIHLNTKYQDEFNSTLLRKKHNNLMNAIYRIFGNFQNALNAASIDFNVQKSTKWDFSSVKHYIELESESGCKLLSREFIDTNQQLMIECTCKNIFYSSLKYFKYNKKQQCDQCGLLKKTNEEFIAEIEKLYGDNIVPNERYNGTIVPIKFTCKEHGEFEATPKSVYENLYGCARCGYEHIAKALSKGNRVCDICESTHKVREFNKTGKNYCSRHYGHMLKFGYIKTKLQTDKNEIILYDNYAEIVLLNKHFIEKARAKVSLDKLELVKKYKWYLMNNDYVSSRSFGKPVLLHRIIMNAEKYEVIDHINRIRTDCRNENLRSCTTSQNCMNTSLSKRNTSGTTGVWFSKRSGKWQTEIFANGKKYRLGAYKRIEDAIEARKQGEAKYFKEFAPNRSDDNA